MDKGNEACILDNVFIAIPLFNEEQVVTEVISALQKVFSNIVVVDDGSTDRSNKLLCDLGVTVISHAVNLGQGAAIKTAFEYISTIEDAFAVVTFDADGQHSVRDAEKLASEIICCKEDVIFGSRFSGKVADVPMVKRLILKFATYITNFITGMHLTDTHNGLKALKVSAVRKLNIDISGYAFESQLIMQVSKHKLHYKEMPTHVYYTEYSIKKGQSIRNSLIIVEDIINLWRMR